MSPGRLTSWTCARMRPMAWSGEVGQPVDARLVGACGPVGRYATGHDAEGKDDHAPLAWDVDDRRRLGVIQAVMNYLAGVEDRHAQALYISALKDMDETPPF